MAASSKQEPPTATSPTSASAFLDAVVHRRSVYGLTSTAPIPDSEIAAILRRAVLHVPSAFNSQSQRTALLIGDRHKAFWNTVASCLAAVSDAEKMARAQKRIDGFLAAHGTVLFFESGDTVAALAKQAAAYADLVPGWSEHASGMLQFAVWTALEAAGCGANLQHYNYEPSVDQKSKELFGLPADWVLRAQLVFGGVADGAAPKEGKDKSSTDETVRIFGADL